MRRKNIPDYRYFDNNNNQRVITTHNDHCSCCSAKLYSSSGYIFDCGHHICLTHFDQYAEKYGGLYNCFSTETIQTALEHFVRSYYEALRIRKCGGGFSWRPVGSIAHKRELNEFTRRYFEDEPLLLPKEFKFKVPKFNGDFKQIMRIIQLPQSECPICNFDMVEQRAYDEFSRKTELKLEYEKYLELVSRQFDYDYSNYIDELYKNEDKLDIKWKIVIPELFLPTLHQKEIAA